MGIDQYNMDMLINIVKSNTYVCDVCGKAIIPDIHLNFDNTVDVVAEYADVGYAYNKRLKKVCKECAKAMSLPLQGNLKPTYKFGDILDYKSPINNSKTKCLFIREEGQKAVVMFENAEFAARVGFNNIEQHNKS